MTQNIWRKVTVAAPAQVGNIFGFFDRAGVLCRPPPLNDLSRDGGPGDLITIERIPDSRSSIQVEYLRRGCDSDGYWDDVEPFTELAEEIRTHPNRCIVDHLVESTVRAISSISPGLASTRSDSLRITVVKHLPGKKVGIGLGSSASSTAVVVGIDTLYGNVLRRLDDDRRVRGLAPQHTRLTLMANGEQLASGARFFDNVAPLLFGSLVFIDGVLDSPTFTRLRWPDNLYLVTVTPELSLTTRVMRDIIEHKTLPVTVASEAAHRRAQVMLGLLTGDTDRVLDYADDSIVEPLRWPLIHGGTALLAHVRSRRKQGFRVAIGIAGSGPSVYCLTDSIEGADQFGAELHSLWRREGIKSWWFVHRENSEGISILETL